MAPGSCAPPGGSQWSPSASTASPPRFPRPDQDGSPPPASDSLTRLGVAVPEGADPLEVMARALSVAAGDLETMRVAVRGVDPTDARNPTVRLYAEALDRAGRLAKVAADTNLAERHAALTESNVRLVADAVRRAVDSVALSLADRQQVVNAVARELRSAANA